MMKKTIRAGIIAGIAVNPAQVLTPAHAQMPKPAPKASPQQSQEIKAVTLSNAQFLRAIELRDIKTLDKCVADEAVFSGGSEGPIKTYSKSSFKQLLLGPDFTIKSLTVGDVTVQWQGQTAVVIANATIEDKADASGTSSKQPFRFLNVFAKRQGRWQVIVSYSW